MEELIAGRRRNNRQVVFNIMRCVEAKLNTAIISNASQNSAEAATTQANTAIIPDALQNSDSQTNRSEDENVEQHLVSSVIVNNVRGPDLYRSVHVPPRELENLSENVNIDELDGRWVRCGRVILRDDDRWPYNRSFSEDHLGRYALDEDTIVIRYILDLLEPDNGEQYHTQIIWNSRFSWRQIMQYLQDSPYNFEFKSEIVIVMNYLVDGLPDVIIREEDTANGDEVICSICVEKFANEECGKQLECKHLYHSKCLRLWFSRKISCPTCRYEPLAPQQ